MTKRIARDPIYRGRRIEAEIIELCVRWYITLDGDAPSHPEFAMAHARLAMAVS